MNAACEMNTQHHPEELLKTQSFGCFFITDWHLAGNLTQQICRDLSSRILHLISKIRHKGDYSPVKLKFIFNMKWPSDKITHKCHVTTVEHLNIFVSLTPVVRQRYIYKLAPL